MRSILFYSTVWVLGVSLSVFSVFGAVSINDGAGNSVDVNGGNVSVQSSDGASVTLNAASSARWTGVGSSLGEYASVACSSNNAFAANSCTQCFDGGKVKTGERLTGLFDTWTNSNSTPQVMYKDEQIMPTMVNLGWGGTEWTSTPSDNTKVWKTTSEIVWSTPSGSGGKAQFFIMPTDKIKFIEADIGAGYNLVKTDKKNDEPIGLIKFPLVYRNIDNVGNESATQTHYECVIYKASTTVTTVTPPPSNPPPSNPPPSNPPKKPNPPDVTKPQTGPETLLLIAAAFFIAFGLMFSLRKNN